MEIFIWEIWKIFHNFIYDTNTLNLELASAVELALDKNLYPKAVLFYQSDTYKIKNILLSITSKNSL